MSLNRTIHPASSKHEAVFSFLSRIDFYLHFL